MADIIPFKGTLYNPEKIKDISKVVAPPYDVISSEEQDLLYNADPHNIIRILYGKDFPQDNDRENKYTRAAGFLKEWQKKGILRKDVEDSIYIYLQEFTIDGQPRRRTGFIALLKLEEFDTKTSSIYPHEVTFDAPKLDRTKLIQSIEANLGPIFALFADEDKAIDTILKEQINSRPIIDILDFKGIRNKLWRISDKHIVRDIVRLMKDKKLFIADGHHRYEVGLLFSKFKKDPKFGYILTYFTNLYAEGTVILPVHRLVAGVSEGTLNSLKQKLERDFTVERLALKEDVKTFLSDVGPLEKRFVLYDKHGFTGLTINDRDSLGVTLLHSRIIEPLKKEVKACGGEILIDFTRDLDYAIKEVDKGRFSFSIILSATEVTRVRDIAFSGKRMPQKSTYFYPKVLTGLVINVF